MGFVLKGDAETVFRLIRIMTEAEKHELVGGSEDEGERRGLERVIAGSAITHDANHGELGGIPAVFLEAFRGD